MPDMNNYPVWPGWETVRLIGQGSYGAVYEIRRDVFGETEKAAMKVITIPRTYSEIESLRGDGYDDKSITETFKSQLRGIVAEYSLMRRLSDSVNVVNCDDVRYVQHDDGFGWDIFIRMELLTPLINALGKGIPDSQVIRVGEDMCRALVLCRRHSIIHRDIKPQNIFVSDMGDYKLGDFGVARTMEKTTGATKIGTYEYMAPEVYHDEPYGSAADLYSVGMVLYWLLNDRRGPFLPLPPATPKVDEREQARVRRFNGEALPSPAHGSERLKRIVLKACAYDLADRYKTAEEMLADLEAMNAPVRTVIPNTSPSPTVRAGEPPAPVSPPAESDPALSAGEVTVSAAVPQTDTVPVLPPAVPQKRGKKKNWIWAAALTAVLLGLVIFFGSGKEDIASSAPQTAAPATTPVVTPRPTVEPIAKGSCGPGCTWALSPDGVLTIEGKGAMTDFRHLSEEVFNTPWFDIREQITRVEIKDGVTSIGDMSFDGCSALTSISIPVSVTSIGDLVFSDCFSLNNVSLPAGVKSIGLCAFADCKSLTSLTIPDGVTSINDYTFVNCAELTDIIISTSVTYIGTSAFSNCKSLKSITIPAGVKSISGYAFNNCAKLTDIIIPASVTSIGSFAFSGCGSLKDIYFTGSEAQWAAIKIEEYNTSLMKAAIHYNS